jgi:hypothetical protein
MWDINNRSWKKELQPKHEVDLKSELDDYFYDITSTNDMEIKLNPAIDKIFENYDKIDLKLIRELNVNAKISTISLAKYYKLDQSTISRRLSTIRENAIDGNLLFFDQSVFNLQYPTLFFGNYSKHGDLDETRFHALVNQGDLPFSSTLSTNERKFVWMVTLPTSKIIEYAKFLWKHTRKLQIFNLDISTSRRFYFLHTNYLDDGTWNISADHIVENPLALLEDNN